MKQMLLVATLVSATLAPLMLSLASGAHAQTTNGTNSALPGGHSGDDKNKPGNGDHGSNGGNGG
jgi:hypothetical protein